jgi:hypothetical protein
VTQYAFPGTTKQPADKTAIVFIAVFPTVGAKDGVLDQFDSVIKTFTIKTCWLPEGCK